MHIRYGYDIALELAQPATILAMADVHSDFRDDIVEETELEVAAAVAAERYIDDIGNVVRRLSAPAGQVSLRLQGVFRAEVFEHRLKAGNHEPEENCKHAEEDDDHRNNSATAEEKRFEYVV